MQRAAQSNGNEEGGIHLPSRLTLRPLIRIVEVPRVTLPYDSNGLMAGKLQHLTIVTFFVLVQGRSCS
jgi:hypothetical protein